MYRNLVTCTALSLLSLSIFAWQLSAAPVAVRPAHDGDLSGVTGGADCFRKVVDSYTCTDQFVQAQGMRKQDCPQVGTSGTYTYWTATGISPEYCAQVGTGASGKTECDSDTPEVCVNLYVCSDSACTNCGTPGTEEKPTNVTLGGYGCQGQ